MMWRMSLSALLSAAAYGFSIGAVHSVRFALRNLIKFPLLIVVTGAVCSACYYVLARSVTRALDGAAVARATLSIYHDTAVLLAAFSPVTLFLALTIERPDAQGLREYPLFLSINVVLVALTGSLAVVRQCRQLLAENGLPIVHGSWLIGAWLIASLFVGAQASWYMRPFCGVVDAPFMLGTQPDFRGAASFYEAVYHVLVPPRAAD